MLSLACYWAARSGPLVEPTTTETLTGSTRDRKLAAYYTRFSGEEDMQYKNLLVFMVVLSAGGAQMQSTPESAQTVKITPLGSHDGEFCPLDRALVFEDPDGTRILYDAGRTVRGPNDPRLGKIDAGLLTHVHGDHIGDSP